MAKIVHFPSKNKGVVDQLEMLLEKAKAGEIESFVFAAELTEYEREGDRRPIVATSWHNADIGDRQYLIAHLQADITIGLVEVNLIED